MPQVQNGGCERAIFFAHACMKETHQQIGILFAPTAERVIEAIDTIEIGAPDREIARPRALPLLRAQLAERTERQAQHGCQAIETTTEPLNEPRAKRPLLGLQTVAQSLLRQRWRQQRAIAGDEPPLLCER